MRAGGLRHRVVRLGLDCMNQVGELHRVLDEKHRDVVADQVVVTLPRIELDGKTAYVTHRIGRAALARHGREAHENGRLRGRILQEVRTGELRHRLVDLEVAVRRRPSCVHCALGNAFVVEVSNFLPEDEVLEQRRTPRARLERVVVVRNFHALIRGQLRRTVGDVVRQLVLFGACTGVGRHFDGGFGTTARGCLVLGRHGNPSETEISVQTGTGTNGSKQLASLCVEKHIEGANDRNQSNERRGNRDTPHQRVVDRRATQPTPQRRQLHDLLP